MSSMWMMRHMQQDQSKPTVPITKTYRRLLREVLSQRGRLLLAAALVLSISMLSLVMPQMTQAAIDNAIPNGKMPLLWWLGLAILLSSMLSGLLTFGQSYLMSVIGQSVVFNLRNKLYNHLQALSMSFFDSRRTGELMSRVTNDIGALQNLITSGVVQLATDSVTFLVVLGILFWDDWRLTLLILATFPFMMITTSRFGQRIRGAYKEVQEGIATVNEHLQDTIASIKVVKSFANERYESERFEERNRRNMDANVKAVRVWSMFFPVLDTLNNFGTVIILIFGGYEVLHGRLTIGQFVVFNTYLRMMSQPVRRFGRMMNTIQQGAAAGERVFEILDTKPDVVDKPDAVELPALRGHVRFEDVTFGYKKDEPVLSHFNLDIAPGQSVALVGPSGAGKSTVANLLTRFYDPQGGRITIDGHDLRDVKAASLRGQMGIVSQEIVLLHGSVRDNIAYGRPGASADEVIAAARAANVHEFVERLPDGYDTPIGERGIRLSGGQRQRVAIARALLKNPRLLILDEATSNLDTESESLIQEALARLLVGRTSLVIAHRLSTIQNADLIVVLDQGRIVEYGSHGQLIGSGGRYSQLHALQFAQ